MNLIATMRSTLADMLLDRYMANSLKCLRSTYVPRKDGKKRC